MKLHMLKPSPPPRSSPQPPPQSQPQRLLRSRVRPSAVLLVRPARFGYNEQTAASNRFQRPGSAAAQWQARTELDRLCNALRRAGVGVCLARDTVDPPKPDAVFPNNWVSWHSDGTIVLYPMHAPNRRLERRQQIVRAACSRSGFQPRRLLDLSIHEREARYLEGTGSLVLDHLHRLAFACRSVRTDEALVREWARLMDYQPVVFDSADADGIPIYHTNVMLAIGTRWSVVCAQAIAPADRARVLMHLRAGARELIEIDRAAMQSFAGNLLELESSGAGTVLVLSARARAALRADQDAWQRLRGSVDELVSVAVPTIEKVGGGSVRCMIAQIPAVMA